jgi:hypothetical protein
MDKISFDENDFRRAMAAYGITCQFFHGDNGEIVRLYNGTTIRDIDFVRA